MGTNGQAAGQAAYSKVSPFDEQLLGLCLNECRNRAA